MKLSISKFLKNQISISFILLAICHTLHAQKSDIFSIESLPKTVFEAPEVYKIPSLNQGDIEAVFYQTLQYKGKPTRAFSYIGIPKSDKPVPAMVLVHGGGGKAFYEWVKIWNDRGYAAIAMSLEGHIPDSSGKKHSFHDYRGPQRVGRFDDIELPVDEQWMYHAVADILLGHSLLASMPEVDANRIGITGISWGGILSSLVSGIDTRLKCAIPVYGAGYLYESKGLFGEHGDSSPEFIEKKKFWDPAYKFRSGAVPTLWVNGDSDAHFSLNITSHSYDVTSSHAYLTIHPSMKHGHPPGWLPNEVPEIYAFADQILKGKSPGLSAITQQPSGRNCIVKYKSDVPILKATIYYQNEPLTYSKAENEKQPSPKKWLSKPLDFNAKDKTVAIQVPSDCRAYYVNLVDEREFFISSILVEL